MVLKTALKRRPVRRVLNVKEEPSHEDLEEAHSRLGKISTMVLPSQEPVWWVRGTAGRPS